MKPNNVKLTGFLVTALAAGAIAHGLYTRFSPPTTEQEFADGAGKSLSRPVEEKDATPFSSVQQISSDEQLRKDMDTLVRQVATLSQSMASLQGQVQSLIAASEPAVKEEKVVRLDNSGEDLQPESPVKWATSRYSSEVRDDEWAASAETVIGAEFAANPDVSGVSLDMVDCRTSLCRVVWQYPKDATNEETFILENEMLAAMNRAGFNASSQSSLDGGMHEGYFWYNPPPPQNTPGEIGSSGPSKGL